jgi:DNA-binding FrmR family transcriptional regulator
MNYPKNIKNRIRRIQGQVKGVNRMMDEQESYSKVMTQLQAVISSLESLKTEMMRQKMKESIVSDVKKTLGIEE